MLYCVPLSKRGSESKYIKEDILFSPCTVLNLLIHIYIYLFDRKSIVHTYLFNQISVRCIKLFFFNHIYYKNIVQKNYNMKYALTLIKHVEYREFR